MPPQTHRKCAIIGAVRRDPDIDRSTEGTDCRSGEALPRAYALRRSADEIQGGHAGKPKQPRWLLGLGRTDGFIGTSAPFERFRCARRSPLRHGLGRGSSGAAAATTRQQSSDSASVKAGKPAAVLEAAALARVLGDGRRARGPIFGPTAQATTVVDAHFHGRRDATRSGNIFPKTRSHVFVGVASLAIFDGLSIDASG